MNPPPNNCPPLCGTHMDSEVDTLKSDLASARAVIAALRQALVEIAEAYANREPMSAHWAKQALALTPASGDKELAELAALRLDRERLEAVAANGWRLSCEFGANGRPNHWICYDKDWSRPEGEGETYNAAIDAARHSLNP